MKDAAQRHGFRSDVKVRSREGGRLGGQGGREKGSSAPHCCARPAEAASKRARAVWSCISVYICAREGASYCGMYIRLRKPPRSGITYQIRQLSHLSFGLKLHFMLESRGQVEKFFEDLSGRIYVGFLGAVESHVCVISNLDTV